MIAALVSLFLLADPHSWSDAQFTALLTKGLGRVGLVLSGGNVDLEMLAELS